MIRCEIALDVARPPAEVSFRLTPQGAGTHIDHAVAITPRAFMAKLMTPMIRGATGRQLAADTATLKRLLESRS